MEIVSKLSADMLNARVSRFPDNNPAAFLDWQRQYRSQLVKLLMNGSLPERVPLVAEIVETEERPTPSGILR